MAYYSRVGVFGVPCGGVESRRHAHESRNMAGSTPAEDVGLSRFWDRAVSSWVTDHLSKTVAGNSARPARHAQHTYEIAERPSGRGRAVVAASRCAACKIRRKAGSARRAGGRPALICDASLHLAGLQPAQCGNCGLAFL